MVIYNYRQQHRHTHKTILLTVVFVAQQLINDKALLLTTASFFFLQEYTGETQIDSIASVELEIDTGNSTVKFTSRWLLHQLISHLHKFMECNVYISVTELSYIKRVVTS